MGYLHPGYTQSLAEFGVPYQLPYSRGLILKRQIPNTDYQDAMGSYPLFSCQNWPQLHLDIDNLAGEMVSLALVTDPFGEYDLDYLKYCFKDVAIPFKMHFVVDLNRDLKAFVSTHHRRYARKALQLLRIEMASPTEELLDDWVRLYNVLIERHHIIGIPAFSRDIFRQQLSVPGATIFRATLNGETVGMLIWYIQGEVAYYHLGAYSLLGYQLHASFGLFWWAIEHFAAIGLKWLNLGAGAGLAQDTTDGLTRFKQQWSTGTRTAFFCGRIFDQQQYQKLAVLKQVGSTDYFPVYRVGEFS